MEKAEGCFEEALRLFRSLHLVSEEASCLGNLGHHYKLKALTTKERRLRVSLLRQAQNFNLKGHRLKVKVSTPRRIAFSQHEIGEVYRLLGKKGHALYWFRRAKKLLYSEKLYHYAEAVARAITETAGPRCRLGN